MRCFCCFQRQGLVLPLSVLTCVVIPGTGSVLSSELADEAVGVRFACSPTWGNRHR